MSATDLFENLMESMSPIGSIFVLDKTNLYDNFDFEFETTQGDTLTGNCALRYGADRKFFINRRSVNPGTFCQIEEMFKDGYRNMTLVYNSQPNPEYGIGGFWDRSMRGDFQPLFLDKPVSVQRFTLLDQRPTRISVVFREGSDYPYITEYGGVRRV